MSNFIAKKYNELNFILHEEFSITLPYFQIPQIQIPSLKTTYNEILFILKEECGISENVFWSFIVTCFVLILSAALMGYFVLKSDEVRKGKVKEVGKKVEVDHELEE